MGFQFLRKTPHRLSWDELCSADDNELVTQLRAGQHDALAVIIDRYQRLILSVALRILRNSAEAEEVVQTVFTDFFRDLERFDASRGTLKMWLLQFAYSRSINRRHYLERRQFYSRTDIEEIDTEIATSNTSFGGLWSSETARLVRQAMASLTPKQQRSIELVYFEGLTLEEASERTGETVSAVRHHYYRGLMKLREVITAARSLNQEEAVHTEGLKLRLSNVNPRTI